jgi:4-hydroxy-tetrahydrodipicolinate reductase
MVNVCFAGITGWTAPPILAAIGQADDLTLSAGVSRSAAGQSLAAVSRGLDSLLFSEPAPDPGR